MATGAVNDDAARAGADAALAAEVAELRAERDVFEQRALEAEALAESLADDLAAARSRLVDVDDDHHHLTLFDGATPQALGGSFAPDGSDKGVLPLALASTAVVALLVGALSLAGSGLSIFALLMLAASACLAWAAWQTRVIRVVVEVVDGVVEVTSEGTTKRFDLRNDAVRIDVQGQPDDTDWRVRFYRRALDPIDVDGSMVDAVQFMAQLREHRRGV